MPSFQLRYLRLSLISLATGLVLDLPLDALMMTMIVVVRPVDIVLAEMDIVIAARRAEVTTMTTVDAMDVLRHEPVVLLMITHLHAGAVSKILIAVTTLLLIRMLMAMADRRMSDHLLGIIHQETLAMPMTTVVRDTGKCQPQVLC